MSDDLRPTVTYVSMSSSFELFGFSLPVKISILCILCILSLWNKRDAPQVLGQNPATSE